MKTVAAKDAGNSFGELLDTARREPVTIARDGQPVAVLLSIEEYERLEAAEDAYWAERADKAAREGEWLGPDESERLLNRMLHAED